MKIIEYRKWEDIDIMFEDGYVAKNRQYNQFKKGTIKNPYDLSVYGVGYLGEGKYPVKNKEKVLTNQYRTWNSMLGRCYDKNVHKREPSYVGCSVCDEWKNFQKYAEWYDENYYDVDGEKMHLDKDILIKNNKIYSPETCIFVPRNINSFFVINQTKRNNYPIGVSFYERYNNFVAQCNALDGKRKTLGYFDTVEEAFLAYKNYKENVAKELAEKYKNKIPVKLYNAIIKFTVNIDD